MSRSQKSLKKQSKINNFKSLFIQLINKKQRKNKQMYCLAWLLAAWLPGLADWPGRLACLPGLAAWPGCLAAWRGCLAWLPGLATSPG